MADLLDRSRIGKFGRSKWDVESAEQTIENDHASPAILLFGADEFILGYLRLSTKILLSNFPSTSVRPAD